MALTVNVSEVSQKLRQAFEPLSAREVGKYASMAINKVLAKDRVFIGRQIRQEYNMNVFDAKSQIVQRLSTINTLIGTLSGDAGFTPFEHFKISGENINTGAAVKVKREAKYGIKGGKRVVVGRKTAVSGGSGRMSTFEVTIKKNRTTLFTHAFIARTKNGPMLFNRGEYNYRTNRFGSIPRRLPMNRLRTLSVWQEMRSKSIMGKSELLLRAEYGAEFFRLCNLGLRRAGHWSY